MDTTLVLQIAGSGAGTLSELVRRAWARCLDTSGAARDVTLRVVLDDDPAVVAAARAGGAVGGSDPVAVMDHLSPRVTVSAITHQAGRLVMLHAAGLADPATGRTTALVAASGTGKTTASRTLGRTLGYVTDETVAIRPDGTIAAYPKPLAVRHDGVPHKEQVAADDLALLHAPVDCTVGAVALLARDGAERPWIESVPTVRALAALAPESSYLASVPRPLHRLAEIVDAGGGLTVLHYADSTQLPELVGSLVAG